MKKRYILRLGNGYEALMVSRGNSIMLDEPNTDPMEVWRLRRALLDTRGDKGWDLPLVFTTAQLPIGGVLERVT